MDNGQKLEDFSDCEEDCRVFEDDGESAISNNPRINENRGVSEYEIPKYTKSKHNKV
jgi:hypothetical protein